MLRPLLNLESLTRFRVPRLLLHHRHRSLENALREVRTYLYRFAPQNEFWTTTREDDNLMVALPAERQSNGQMLCNT